MKTSKTNYAADSKGFNFGMGKKEACAKLFCQIVNINSNFPLEEGIFIN